MRVEVQIDKLALQSSLYATKPQPAPSLDSAVPSSVAVAIILPTFSFDVSISTFYRLLITLRHINYESEVGCTDALQLTWTYVFRICGTFSVFHYVQIGSEVQVTRKMKYDGD